MPTITSTQVQAQVSVTLPAVVIGVSDRNRGSVVFYTATPKTGVVLMKGQWARRSPFEQSTSLVAADRADKWKVMPENETLTMLQDNHKIQVQRVDSDGNVLATEDITRDPSGFPRLAVHKQRGYVVLFTDRKVGFVMGGGDYGYTDFQMSENLIPADDTNKWENFNDVLNINN